MMKINKQLYLFPTAIMSSLIFFANIDSANAIESNHLPQNELVKTNLYNQIQDKLINQKDGEKLTKEEAKTYIESDSEDTSTSKIAKKYMSKGGCDLTEKLPKSSNIFYKPVKKHKVATVHKVVKGAFKENPKTVKTTTIQTVSQSKKDNNNQDVQNLSKSEENKIFDTKAAIQMTKEERYWLEQLVAAEAGGEPYEGVVAVASIIANRVDSSLFPNNVNDVIRAPKQFSPFTDGRINKVTPNDNVKVAVKQVFDEGKRNLPNNVTFFCTTEVASHSWIGQTKKEYKEIGHHTFFYQ